MLDAYTVRKAIPRIVVAVIGINLSIYLCVALIDITNIIGNGLGQLISGPFVGDGVQVAPDTTKLSGNIVNQGVLALIFGVIIKSLVTPGPIAIIAALFPLLLIVALVALAVLFTLIIRQGLILFLTVIAPVAIALFVLPGTEKYFKKWLDLFIKTLMVYPIIAVLFAVSSAMVAIMLGDANASTPGADQTIKLIAAIVVLYAPLVLIPFAFKLAGGAISAVMNAAQGATDKKRRGLTEGRAKGLAETKADRKAKLKAGQLYEGKKWLPGSQRIANRINRAGLSYGTGLRGHYGIGQTGENARQNSLEATTAAVMQSTEYKKIQNNDDALRAGTYATESQALTDLTERWAQRDAAGNITTEGREVGRQRAVRAIQQYKTSGMKYEDRAAQQASAKGMVVTGTSYDDMGDMTEVLARASGGNASAASSLAGFANSTTKQVGRWDLAPSYGTLNDLVQARAGTGRESDAFRTRNGAGAPTQATYDTATIQAVRESTDAGTLARTSKPRVYQNINEVVGRAQERGREATRTGNIATVQESDVILQHAANLMLEGQSNRYSTPGAVTDQIDVYDGPEAGDPRIYKGPVTDDPRLRGPDEPNKPPAPEQ